MNSFIDIWLSKFIIGFIASLFAGLLILYFKRVGPRIMKGAIILSIILSLIAVVTYKYFKSPIVEVPDVIGKYQAVAVLKIEELNLQPIVIKKHDNTIPKLRVISQNPLPGAMVKRNTKVKITICDDPEPKPKVSDSSGSDRHLSEPISPEPDPKIELKITKPKGEVLSHGQTEWVSFSVKGTLGGNQSYKNVGIYVLVYPEIPFGGGWYIQAPKATIDRRAGTWFANAQLGSEGSPVSDGDTFRIVSVATNEITKMDELRRVESLQDMPEHIQSDIINLTLRRPQIPSQIQQSSEQVTITHVNDLPVSHSIHIDNRHFIAKGVISAPVRRADLRVLLYVRPPGEHTYYMQDDMQGIYSWRRMSGGSWKGEWKVGGHIGREGMDYKMRFTVWAVVVFEGQVNSLSNFYGSIGQIRELTSSAVWSDPLVIIKTE